jgi:hypothetical protein
MTNWTHLERIDHIFWVWLFTCSLRCKCCYRLCLGKASKFSGLGHCFKSMSGWWFCVQYVKVHVPPYQTLRSRFPTVRSASPLWNEDLMFVVSEPFDDLLHILVEDRIGGTVSVDIQEFWFCIKLVHSTLIMCCASSLHSVKWISSTCTGMVGCSPYNFKSLNNILS